MPQNFCNIFVKNSALKLSPHGQNGRHFADDIFRRIFVNDKFSILIKISLKFVPKCWQYTSIGLDNGLAPNRRQATIQTNAVLIHWRIYAALEDMNLAEWKARAFSWCLQLARTLLSKRPTLNSRVTLNISEQCGLLVLRVRNGLFNWKIDVQCDP